MHKRIIQTILYPILFLLVFTLNVNAQETKQELPPIKNEITKEESEQSIKDKINNGSYTDFFKKAYITPAGGILKTRNIRIGFPQGTVNEDIVVTYSQTKGMGSSNRVGSEFTLTAKTLDGRKISTFNKPVSITSNLSGEDIRISQREGISAFYFNETTGAWESVGSTIEGNQLITLTSHFSLYSVNPNSTEEQQAEEEEYLYKDCGFVVDNSDPFEEHEDPDIDTTHCFESYGDWVVQNSGVKQNSLVSNQFNATAYWYPDYENLEGTVEVFSIVPNIRLGDEEAEIGETVEYAEEVKYYVRTNEGEEEVIINMNEERGKVSLGEFEFNGEEAYVYLWGLNSDEAEEKFITADAICFGDCTGIGDINPPTIEDAIAMAHQGLMTIQATIKDDYGVASAYVSVNGTLYPMVPQGDTYSALLPYPAGANLDWYIVAYDTSSNETIWSPTLGYVMRGPGFNIGIPPWATQFLKYKQNYYSNAVPAARPGADPCVMCAGDPIDTSTGNLLEQVNILNVNSRPDIEFNISYNGLGGAAGIFGENWVHDYNYHLTIMDNAHFNGAFLQYPSGAVVTFEGPNLTPEAGVNDTLKKEGGTYTLTLADQTQINFDGFGDISRIEDLNGNGLNFTYAEQIEHVNLSKLDKIVSDGGREATFNYTPDGFVDNIVAAEGKIINFEYSPEYDLVKVVDANGEELKFEYDDHSITRKISPLGHAYYENEFDDQRRVISQKAGTSFAQEYSYAEAETTVADLNGTVAKYAFDDMGKMTASTSEVGNQKTFEYNADNKVTAEIDADGNRFEYRYDNNGNQIYIKDGNGKVIQREFDDNNRMVKEIDPENRTKRWEYNSKGNLIKEVNAEGEIAEYEYDEYGQLTKSIDFNRNKTEYKFSSNGDLIEVIDALEQSIQYTYDDLGRKKTETDKRNQTYTYTYDNNDNLLRIDGPIGFTKKYEYDRNNRLVKEYDANGNLTEYTYDNSENFTNVKDKMGFESNRVVGPMNEVLEEVDAEGAKTKYEYTEDYNPRTVIAAAGTGVESTTRIEYNWTGLQERTIDGEGNITEFEYDSLYRRITQIEDAEGERKTTRYAYNPGGTLSNVTDPNGNKTTYTYDNQDRLVRTVDAEGNETRHTYDAMGNLLTQKNPRGFETKYEYDALNRVVKMIDADGNATRYEYDENDNMVKQTLPNKSVVNLIYNELNRLTQSEQEGVATEYTYDLNGNVKTIKNPRGYTTKFEYDKEDRQTAVIDAKGEITKYTYDKVGNLVQVVDRNNNPTENTYDELNRLIEELNAENHTKGYAYDKNNNPTTFTDGRGTPSNFEYDGLNRLTKTTDVYNNSDIQTYDKVGNIKSQLDKNQNSTSFIYNKINRLVSTTNAENEIREIVYDQNSNPITQIDENLNPINYTYDKLDKVVKVIDAENQITEYKYDEMGNMIEVINPRGHKTYQEYDAFNRVTKTTNALEGTIEYEYDKNGNQTLVKDQNGTKTQFIYDELDRVIKKIDAFDATGNNNDIGLLTEYSYDPEGNLIRMVNPRGIATTFTYDKTNRNILIIDIYGNSTRLTYDEVNNLVESTDKNNNSSTWDYDKLNRVIEEENAEGHSTQYEYDPVGNTVKLVDANQNPTTYEYNKVNRVIKAIDALQGEWKTTYDAVGNTLVSTDANGHTNSFTYDRVYRTLNQTNGEGHIQSLNYDPNGNMILNSDRNGNPTQFTYDKLDRLIHKLDAQNGNWDYTYDPVGNILSENDANGHIDKFEYDNMYRKTNNTDAEGFETQFRHDENGNLVRLTDGNTNPTIYTYDKLDRLVSELNAEGEEVTYEYDNEINQTDKIDPDGVTKYYDYDKVYQIIGVTHNYTGGQAKGADLNVNTKYSYDPNGNFIQMMDPNGHITKFEYDELNRQVKETDAEGNAWEYGYDPVGNRTVRIDANNNLTNYGYYADDQLRESNYYDQTSVNYTYDKNNNRTGMSDTLGTTNWTYDALNRNTYVNDSLERSLEFTYDGVGNRLSIKYPDTRVVEYDYLDNDWLNNMVDPEDGLINYTRDGVGNTLQIENSNETETTINYDKVYRPLEIANEQLVGAQKTNSKFNYTYNNVGLRTETTAEYGWRQPSVGNTEYEYDDLRRLVRSDDSENKWFEYAYDRAGNRLELKTGDDNTSTRVKDWVEKNYDYNKINQILSTTEEGISQVTATRTKDNGNNRNMLKNTGSLRDELHNLVNAIEAQRGNHVTEGTADDLLALIDSISMADGEDPTLTYEAALNVIDQIEAKIVAEVADGGTQNSFLVKLNNAKVAIEGIDIFFSNIQKRGVTKTTRTPLSTTTFKYDNNGNRINMEWSGPQGPGVQGFDYSYDPENRLISAIDYQHDTTSRIYRGQTSMQYDGAGRRLVKVFDPKGISEGGAKRTEYVFDNLDPVAEYNIWNPQYENFYRGDGNRMAMSQHFPSGTQGQRFWFHYDALDSVVGLSKQSGQSEHNYRYGDFGIIETMSGRSGNTSGGVFADPHSHYTYTGVEWDDHMNLYEFYSRAYDPYTGTWTRQDDYRGEMQNPMSKQRYMYVNNGPVNWKDMYGYYWLEEQNNENMEKVDNFFYDSVIPVAQTISSGADSVSWGDGYVGTTMAGESFVAETVIGLSSAGAQWQDYVANNPSSGWSIASYIVNPGMSITSAIKGPEYTQDILDQVDMYGDWQKELERTMGVHQEEYYHNGEGVGGFFEDMFYGLGNVGCAFDSQYSARERWFTGTRAGIDVFNIVTIAKSAANGIQKGAAKFGIGVSDDITKTGASMIDDGVNLIDDIGNSSKGSTGRTTPNNLQEDIFIRSVQKNPLNGAQKLPIKIGDHRWPSSEGWGKYQRLMYNSSGAVESTMHFNYNSVTGAVDDIKFVYPE